MHVQRKHASRTIGYVRGVVLILFMEDGVATHKSNNSDKMNARVASRGEALRFVIRMRIARGKMEF